MTGQRYHKGDLVRIADDLGPSMSHFTSGCDAIIIGSYADRYGGREQLDFELFTLHLRAEGETSWYHADQLTLIQSGRADLLEEWQAEGEAMREQKADLDWIFASGQSVLTSPHGASVQALANCLGITNLWGAHGEGYTYYVNASTVLALAAPYLIARDKDGWLAAARRILSGGDLPEAWARE